MLLVSQALRDRIKLHHAPAYKLAIHIANCHPTTFSKLLSGAARVQPNDTRIVAVGQFVGLEPEACFEDSESGDEVKPAEDSEIEAAFLILNNAIARADAQGDGRTVTLLLAAKTAAVRQHHSLPRKDGDGDH